MARLSRARTLAYSAGQFVAGMFFAFNNFTLPLYLGHFTNNNIIIGWLSSTRSFEQSIIQPLVGARSDRTWTRVGRRAPFFLATMPLVGLLMVLNGLIPHDFAAAHNPAQPHAPEMLPFVIIVVFLFSLLFNIGIDPYYALLVDVTTAEERGTKNGIAQVFGFGGQVALLLIAAWLWSIYPPLVFFLVAGCVAAGFITVAMGVREPRELRHRAIEAAPASRRIANVRHARDWVQQHLQVFRPIATRGLYERSVGVVIAVADLALYIVSLFDEQREAVKLLGVKFLYQFGINAAVPFLTLFIVEEIGTNGWLDMLRAIGLAGSGLAGIDAQGISQLMAAVLLLITAAFAIPVGLLGDRFGKKRIFALGLFVMGSTALLAAFAVSIPQLLLYLLFLGFGNAALTVLFGVYLAELIPAERVGEFTGLTAFAETGGVFLSILVAGEVINLNLFGLKYRMIFLITGVFLLLALGAVTFVKARLGDAPVVETGKV